MPDTDVRVETLEDEIRVLKGEVRRTLVDLRALLMSADSPLNEANFGRRGVSGEGGGDGGSPRKRCSISSRMRIHSPKMLLGGIWFTQLRMLLRGRCR